MNKKIDAIEIVSVDHIYGEMLAALYQGGSEPQPWSNFLKILCIRAGCDVAALVFRSENQGLKPAPLWHSRVQPSAEQIEQYKLAQAETGYFDPLIDALSDSERVLRLDQVVAPEQLKRSSHYQKLMEPFGLEHAIGMRIGQMDGITFFVALLRGPDKLNFGKKTAIMLSELKIHLQLAIELRALQKKQEAGKRIYSDVLNSLTVATVILDGKGKVLEVNEAASAILKRNSCMAILGGYLVPERHRHSTEFNRVLKAAVTHWEKRITEPFVDALRMDSTGGDIGVLIRTAPHFDWYQTENVPNVIVHLDDFEAGQSAPEQIIARLFRLTRAESRLTACLVQGLTLVEAANRLGITESSARTYSKKIFCKTGVSRQTDLVRLVLKSVALLARKPPSQ